MVLIQSLPILRDGFSNGCGDLRTRGIEAMHSRFSLFAQRSCALSFGARCLRLLWLVLPLLMTAYAGFSVPPAGAQSLALTPPMGWNDWAHYQCGFTEQTILSNANMLVSTGLAARGYKVVTIDDCWMLKTRDANGNLQADPARFPRGMKPVADAIHQLGLKFGIYEDAGYETCGKFAGSGWLNGGGQDHFLQDARLFASWGVDYLKLDACNVYVGDKSERLEAFRKAYASENEALKKAGRPVVFSESAPAYFERSPEWYDVLTWVRQYGQLWREGDDIANYHAKNPDEPRFKSVLWNYAYNLPLGRFEGPGNWDDADFIIGGDSGMSMAETRSQMALWSMMSAPLILSSDLSKLSPESLAILGNKAVIAVDQDPLGQMATLVERTMATDLLLKPLKGANYAAAVLNRGDSPARVRIAPSELGFAAGANCRVDAQNLWNGERQSSLGDLEADVPAHDTAIWRIHPGATCGKPMRTGAIVMTVNQAHGTVNGYALCLASSGKMEECVGGPEEKWTVTPSGALRSAAGCLAAGGAKAALQKCAGSQTQHWRYTLAGNLVNAMDKECLTSETAAVPEPTLSLQTCGHNRPDQIWSLPN
jgi:alpha-galactosidase